MDISENKDFLRPKICNLVVNVSLFLLYFVDFGLRSFSHGLYLLITLSFYTLGFDLPDRFYML